MNATSAIRCAACHKGELTPTQLTVTLTYDGKSFSVDDDDALLCNACGDELIGERATAFLFTQRALAPHAEMTATVTRRTEIVGGVGTEKLLVLRIATRYTCHAARWRDRCHL